jgi:hypothetical protein
VTDDSTPAQLNESNALHLPVEMLEQFEIMNLG